MELGAGDMVLERGDQVRASLFPVGPTMISMVVELSGGRSPKSLRSGAKARLAVLSAADMRRLSRARKCWSPGPALRVPMDALEDAKSRSHFIANLFCHYSDYLLSAVMQSAACNAFHSIPGEDGPMAAPCAGPRRRPHRAHQEAFAGLLGVQRTTVNAVVKELQLEGLIATGRGNGACDRPRRASSAAHVNAISSFEDHYAAVIGTTGPRRRADQPRTSSASISPAWNGTSSTPATSSEAPHRRDAPA